MKRKLNENLTSSVKIDVVSLVNDYPDLLNNVDKIARLIEQDNEDVVITQEEDDDTVYMVINGLTPDEISDIFDSEYYIDDIADYFTFESEDHLPLEDVEDIPDDTESEYIDDEMDEDYGLDDNGEWLDLPDDPYAEEAKAAAIEDMQDEYGDDYIPDYDDIDIEDEETYEDVDDDYDDDEALNDGEFDNCVECENTEDADFECYESRKPIRRNKKVNLSESLKKLSTKEIIESAKQSVKSNVLTESIIAKANNKAKKENKAAVLESLKESLGEDKFNLIVKSLKEGKTTLYSKKTINGKNIQDYTSKELLNILNTVKEQCDTMKEDFKSLNESVSLKKKRAIRSNILNKEHLMEILDEELTYRLTLKKLLKEQKARLNEDETTTPENTETVKEEEENPLAPLPVDPIPTGDEDAEEPADDSAKDEDTEEGSGDENPEEDEEVELSRVVITVANQEAADELKDSMINAGIPEDAIEIETESDEDEESDEDSESDEDTEETSEEGTEDTEENTEEGSAEESNESVYFGEFKKLLEDDESEPESDEDEPAEDSETSDDAADDSEESTDEDSDEDKSEEGAVKVILTNTDYVNDLADVLNNEYGISKEEFEEMIGGEIVDDSDDENTDEDSEESSEDSDEKSDDEGSSNGDDAIDNMSQEDLNNLFGGN